MEIAATGSAGQAATAGLLRARADLNGAAQSIAKDGPNVQSAVKVAQSATDFKANAAVLKTADEMERSLLDILV